MNLGWKNIPKKLKIVRIANLVGLAVIVVLLAFNKERFEAMLNPASGKIVSQLAPELAEGEWINSVPLSLQSLRGKVVVLDFWTHKCRNCVNILPNLKEWYRKYNNRGVVVVGVHSPETEEEANLETLKKFVGENGIEYPIVTDNESVTWNRYHAQFWPSTFIIDQQGMVRKFHYGELGISSLEDTIVELLKTNS